ncbi:MAG: 7-cyano-7-deazaguanine synthase QueC [Candidatus Gastranaerophilaceae bacterium]|jgi:7-cyano-7-deazaguanine synthase
MSNKKSVILLSGGLDSVVSLAFVKNSYNIQLALTFDYGQKSAAKEIEAAKKIADFYNIKQQVIKLDWLENITQTALVNKNEEMPFIEKDQLDNYELAIETAKNVWVPNRNGVFINIAASFCDSYCFTNIIFGANKEEGTTFPDNTQEFIDRINLSLEYSTLQNPKLVAPLIELDKSEIIKKAIELKVPFNLISSCYSNLDLHCGKCESCQRLKRGLENAGLNHVINSIFNNA